ncbi:MAG: 3D domain-containing protein [Candidatus Thorarchaeota archaeon]
MLRGLGILSVVGGATLMLLNPTFEKVKTTGYCAGPPCVDEKWADGKTASGTEARRGVCASDWKYFPKGAVFHIPGYGSCTVEDTGNPKFVKGNHLDLYFDTESEAWDWGVQYKTILVISWPEAIERVAYGK